MVPCLLFGSSRAAKRWKEAIMDKKIQQLTDAAEHGKASTVSHILSSESLGAAIDDLIAMKALNKTHANAPKIGLWMNFSSPEASGRADIGFYFTGDEGNLKMQNSYDLSSGKLTTSKFTDDGKNVVIERPDQRK